MIALWWKESLSLLPYWFAVVAIVSLSFLLQALGTDLTLAPLSSRVDDGESGLFLVFLLAFTIGHGLAAPEFVEGPIEFLDSLPLSRFTVYAAKVFAGILPCLGLIFGSMAADVFLAQFGPAPPGADATMAVIVAHLVFLSGAVAGLGLGLLLSWIRGLAWGVLLLVVMVMMVAAVLQPMLQPYTLLASWGNLEFINRQVSHPVGPLVFWSGLGLFGMLASGALFLGPGEMFTRRGSWATGGTRIAVMGCMGLCVLTCSGASILGLAVQAQELFKPVEIEETASFRVLYRGENRDHVIPTIANLDAISAEVAAMVGNPNPLHLDLEFLGAPENHGGLFTGGKIRLREDADVDVVAHELAHAHSFAVSGPSAWHQSKHVRFFEEGMASWTADRRRKAPEIPPLAAAIHAVDPIAFDLLVEDSQFQIERDMAQAYPLGVAFVEALDDFGGVETRRCVLQGIGEAGARKTAGLALWDSLGRRCNFELDAVIHRFRERLETAAETLPEFPDLEARVDGTRVLVNTRDGGDWRLVCRFRDMPEAEVSHYVHVDVFNGQCAIPLWRLSGMTFEYQVGFRFDDNVVFDRWTTAPRR